MLIVGSIPIIRSMGKPLEMLEKQAISRGFRRFGVLLFCAGWYGGCTFWNVF